MTWGDELKEWEKEAEEKFQDFSNSYPPDTPTWKIWEEYCDEYTDDLNNHPDPLDKDDKFIIIILGAN